jgi:integrase
VLDGLVLLGRRISELCRIERQHINVEKRTYWVYDLKNSEGKGHHGEAPLIEGAWELVEAILAEIPNEPTARLFPYNSKTCSQRQTLAKKELQKLHPHLFVDLHMHDQRAYCFTELLKKGYTALQVKRVSLHATTKMIDTVYGRLTAVDVVQGPLGQPMQPRELSKPV